MTANFNSHWGALKNFFLERRKVSKIENGAVAKVYGTLDYPKKGIKERTRCNFNALLFTFEQGTIILTMMYEKEDRYAPEIEQRIINSLELVKEL